MRKFILLVGLIVFLTPMVVNAYENDLLNFHCIEDYSATNKTTKLSKANKYCFAMKPNGKVYSLRSTTTVDNFGVDEKNISYGVFLECGGVPLHNDYFIPIKENEVNYSSEEINDWLTNNLIKNQKENKSSKKIWDGTVCKKNSSENSEFCWTKKELSKHKKNCKGVVNKMVKTLKKNCQGERCPKFDKKTIEKRVGCPKPNITTDYSKKPIEDYVKICRENTISEEYFVFARSLGCNPNKKNLYECVQRYLPSIIGSGPITLDEVGNLVGSKEFMSEVVVAIEELNRQQNQSQNQEPTEEEKQQALAQQNATGQATWKYTSTGIGYFDFGNGFGWAPPNPKRDKIISGLLVSQRTKNKLMIGSKGRTIFVPR